MHPWWYLVLMLLGYRFLMDVVHLIAKRLEPRIPIGWRPILCGPTTKKTIPFWIIIVVGFYAALIWVTLRT